MTDNPRWDAIREDLDYISKLPKYSLYLGVGEVGDGDFWCQATYGRQLECGTAACLAGWHLLRNGYTFEQHERMKVVGSQWYDPDGDAVECSTAAQQDYGIALWQARELFHASNSIEDMRMMVDYWERGEKYVHPFSSLMEAVAGDEDQ